ncbi:sulfoxide reductase heme-binding subunit YedZ [Dechloromonas sp. XY25]|uniref:Protein-methionine-sulfoxide reductase heme-binding subunit MsrQ n=1 Tax=Dechloromonas hankyongensis TaxID=2908002 RepID=A0ABS9K5V0_9RHOO|nr:protein-methionine-sulfoxide reductase heme-binding subunit MsrQ [Dechloromonas hankyongensis]MCG2578454.1 sulfoxide reductase heme-binding subunit YedZ [Dechloromonas hankyongensis]
MTHPPDARHLGQIKAALFLVCLLPFARLLWAVHTDDFGSNPVEFVQRWTGTWTFNLLLVTLCVTPLRAMTAWHWLIRLRRMLGLFCFFYATLHFLSFIGFDHAFDITGIGLDIVKRPFVTVGFAAFLLLVPLAATSNQWAVRQLGGRKWQELHRNIYLTSILACIHYFWLVKATALLWPLAYSAVVALLLGWRIRERRRKAIPAPRVQPASPLRFFKQKPD